MREGGREGGRERRGGRSEGGRERRGVGGVREGEKRWEE